MYQWFPNRVTSNRGDKKRGQLGKKGDEYGSGYIVCEVAVRYPAKDVSMFSEA